MNVRFRIMESLVLRVIIFVFPLVFGEKVASEDAIHKYPFFVKVSIEDRISRDTCGGTIMTDMHIMTAASCLAKYTKNRTMYWVDEEAVTVFSGDDTFDFTGMHGQKHLVASYQKLDQFTMPESGYDVAVLNLKKPIKFDNYRQPLKKCQMNDFPKDQNYHMIAVGFGTGDDSTFSKRLRELELTEVDDSVCRYIFKIFPGAEQPPKGSQICHNDKINDTCKGDTGGPLFLVDDTTQSEKCFYGVISYNINDDCRDPSWGTVAARVTFYFDKFDLSTNERGDDETTASTSITQSRMSDKETEISTEDQHTRNNYPFYVTITEYSEKRLEYERLCHGTIVTNINVMTAASCPRLSKGAENITVVSGNNNQDDVQKHAQLHVVASIQKLHQFKHPVTGYDITVFNLKEPIKFDEYRQPLRTCNTTENPKKTGFDMLAIALQFQKLGPIPDIKLKEFKLNEISESKCRDKFKRKKLNAPKGSQICHNDKNADTCSGDRGGPLVLFDRKTESTKCLYGVNSWNFDHGCRDPKWPTAATRVSYYTDNFTISTDETKQEEDEDSLVQTSMDKLSTSVTVIAEDVEENQADSISTAENKASVSKGPVETTALPSDGASSEDELLPVEDEFQQVSTRGDNEEAVITSDATGVKSTTTQVPSDDKSKLQNNSRNKIPTSYLMFILNILVHVLISA